MTLKPGVLGGLLKRLYEDFSVSNFADRLKVQKFVYILQNRGINIGYLFNFYLYGPYSTDLTRTAFQIEDFSSIKETRFVKSEVETKFENILSKLQNHKDDVRWLEGASSILFLAEMKYSRKLIYSRLFSKKIPFEKEQVDVIWKELEEWGWIE